MDNIIGELPKSALVGYVDALPSFEPADLELVSDYRVGDDRPETLPAVLENGTEEEELDADFQQVRQNLADLSSSTKEVVADMMELARQTESPRAYEVLTTAISTLLGANKDLLEAHAKRADIKKKLKDRSPATQEGSTTNIQNNAVFVGTSTDLLDLLQKQRG
jgi:hypothetical protein